jgi:hypothetical protein
MKKLIEAITTAITSVESFLVRGLALVLWVLVL